MSLYQIPQNMPHWLTRNPNTGAWTLHDADILRVKGVGGRRYGLVAFIDVTIRGGEAYIEVESQNPVTTMRNGSARKVRKHLIAASALEPAAEYATDGIAVDSFGERVSRNRKRTERKLGAKAATAQTAPQAYGFESDGDGGYLVYSNVDHTWGERFDSLPAAKARAEALNAQDDGGTRADEIEPEAVAS